MSTIRFVHTGDAHIDSSTHGTLNPLTGINRAWESHAACLTHIVNEAIDQRVDFVVHAGDGFDAGRPSQEALNLFADCLTPLVDAGIPLVLFDGNHERIRVPASFRTATATVGRMLGKLGEVHVVDDPGLLRLDSGIQIACLPWLSKTQVLASLGLFNLAPSAGDAKITEYAMTRLRSMCSEADDSEPLIMASHVTVDDLHLDNVTAGHRRGSEVDLAHLFSEPILPRHEIEELPIPYAALSHIHAPQRIGKVCHYAGSPDRLTFIDADDDKGANLVTLEDRTLVSVERIATPARAMSKISLSSPGAKTKLASLPRDALVELTLPPGETSIPDDYAAALEYSGAVLAKTNFTPVPVDRPAPASIDRELGCKAALKEWWDIFGPKDVSFDDTVAVASAMEAGD